MNFKHLKNLQECIDGMKKIFSISWSPNLLRLAIAHVDEKRNVRISLFDENGERKETFPTRAANKTNKSYVVRDIAFSPDSIKLAVSQSDNIVFVYNLGSNWGDKKTICNKFEQNTQVTVMVWPHQRPNEIYFGVAEGKVKLGMLKTNSAQILYSADSYVVSMCSSIDGKFLFTGHLDCSVYKYNIETTSSTKIVQSLSIPYCLSSGVRNEFLVAGNDTKVIFYTEHGEKIQTFEYSHDDKLKDFTLSRINSAFDTIAVGNFDKLFIFMYNSKKNQWEEACIKTIENYYTVTSLCWKPEVNTLVAGSLCGSVDIFESCLKKSLYGDKFEITYISHYQVLVKNIESGRRVTLKSNCSTEIIKLSIHMDNYVIINTKESMMVCDLNNQKSSEILWNFTGNEKYDFSNANVCMIYHLSEITIVEYGNDEIVGYCRTEYIHPNLVSARIVPQGINYNNANNRAIKLIAYLIDPFTIYVQDLNSQNIIVNFTHDKYIEFLDFNRNGSTLLFRDNNRHLFLYIVSESRKVTLLNFCSFVQWVPGAEVLVAQDRKNMIIWYNLEDLDNSKIVSIKGDIEEVRRVNDRTEVYVDEGGDSVIYLLEEKLIRLSIAIEQSDLSKAVSILESMSDNISSESDVYWKALSKIALSNKNLLIGQRCFAAVGAYSKANYIKKIMKDVDGLGIDHPVVEAKLLILDKQFANAENVLLSNKLVSEAINIFNEIHRYEESLRIAEKYNIPELTDIKDKYYTFLMDNELYDKAAEEKVKEGNLIEAIKLYIKGDLYIKAANLILREKVNVEASIIDFLVNSMRDIGIFEKAAELLEFSRDYDKAIELYIKANHFPKAIELTRKIRNKSNNNITAAAEYTKPIEELWGDYLTSQRQIELSVEHYIDAGRLDKAIDALISSRKWDKAAEFSEKLTDENLRANFYSLIADHYLKEKNYDLAEKFYLKSANKNFPQLIELYTKNKKWEKLELFIENQNLHNSNHVKSSLVDLAMKFSNEGKFREAEKLFIYANEPDLAITMYKNIKQYDEMINLVEVYMPDYLDQTLLMIAQLCEEEKNLKLAEKFFLKNKSWKLAVDMYYRNNMTEDCLHVANSNADCTEDFLNICLQLFKDNAEEGKQILIKLDMIDHCIKFLCFMHHFEEALKLAQSKSKEMIAFVYLRFGIEMKDSKNYEKAEECFIKANEPKEAVAMYLDKEDFNNALRVARNHSEESINEIYYKQGIYFIKRDELSKAEICLVKAGRPDAIFNLYLEMNLRDKAISFAEKNAPYLLKSNDEEDPIRNLAENISDYKLKSVLNKCLQLEKMNNYADAIEMYLQIPQQEIKDKTFFNIIYQKVLDLSKFTDKEFRLKVIDVVVRKYLSLEEFMKAGDLLKKVENYEEAITCFMMGNNIQNAQDLINQIENETDRDYLQSVLNKKISSSSTENFDELINEGKNEECLIKLKETKSDSFNKYFIKISSNFFMNRQFLDFSNLILRVDPLFTNKTISILKTLASEILAEENLDELENLKLIFEKKEDNYLNLNESREELERLHRITHYQLLKLIIKEYENKLPDLYYCLCLSVLQYGDVIKLDLAILDAVKICNKLRVNGNAFIFTNKYLDLYEYIEFGGNLEEDAELRKTNIQQKNIYVSANNIITASEKEDLHKWIVNKTIDKNIDKGLNMVTCMNCKSEIFEANLACNKCNFRYEQCIVSGFPITDNNYSTCKNCERNSIDKFWRDWINLFHYCPWCRTIYN